MLDKLNGWKTYIAAIGGVGLAIYLLSQGDYQGGVEALLAAFGLSSLRHSNSKIEAAVNGR